MQAIGICRFSYPAIGGFQVQHETVEDRCAFLYRPERLDTRFRYFETLTLPALRAQTDPDFTFLVIIGDNFPPFYRARLEHLLADLPQAILQALPPGQHRPVMKGAINSVRQDTGQPCLQFRMDDDDAVGIDFVRALRAKAADHAAPMHENRHVAFDFSHGFVARPGAEGLFAREVTEPLTTAGLAISVRPDTGNSILNFAHHRLGKFMPVVTDEDAPMFLRGHSDMNDSRQKAQVRSYDLALLDTAGEARFRDLFGIDADKVRAAFSAR